MISALTVKIRSLKMKVKFKANLHLEKNGLSLTRPVSHKNHEYLFNQQIQLNVQPNKNLQLQAIITTDKGSRYTGGIVSIVLSEFVEMKGGQLKTQSLLKCVDKQAKVEIQFVKITKIEEENKLIGSEIASSSIKQTISKYQVERANEANHISNENQMRKQKEMYEEKLQQKNTKLINLQKKIQELETQFNNVLESEKQQLSMKYETQMREMEANFMAELQKCENASIVEDLKDELEEKNNIIYELQLELNEERMFKGYNRALSPVQSHRLIGRVGNLQKSNKLYEKFQYQARQKIRIGERNQSKLKERLNYEHQECIRLRKQNSEMKEKIKIIDKANSQMVEKIKQINKELATAKNDYHSAKFELQLKENTLLSGHQLCKDKEKQLENKVEEKKKQIQNLSGDLLNLRATIAEKEKIVTDEEQEKRHLKDKAYSLDRQMKKLKQALQEYEQEVEELKIAKEKYKRQSKDFQIKVDKLEQMVVKYNSEKLNVDKVERDMEQANKNIYDKKTQIQALKLEGIRKDREIKEFRERAEIGEKKLANLIFDIEKNRQENEEVMKEFYDVRSGDQFHNLAGLFKRQRKLWKEQEEKLIFQLNQLKQELEYKNENIQELMENIDKYEISLEQSMKSADYLRQLLKTRDQQMESINNEHNELLHIHEDYIISYNRYKVEIQQENHEQIEELEELRNEKSQLREKMKQLEDQLRKQVQEKRKTQISFKQIETTVSKTQDQRERLDKQLLERSEQHRAMQEENANQSQEIFTLQIRNNELESKNEELQKEVKQKRQALFLIVSSKESLVNENIAQSKLLTEYELELMNLKEDKENAQSSMKSFEKSMTDWKIEQRKYKQEVRNLNENLQQLEEKSKQLERRLGEEKKKVNETIEVYELMEDNQKQKIQKLTNKVEEKQKEFLEKEDQYLKEKYQLKSTVQEMNFQIKEREDQNKKLKGDNTLLEMQVSKLTEAKQADKEDLKTLKQEKDSAERQMKYYYNMYEKANEQLKEKEEALFTTAGKLFEIEKQNESIKKDFDCRSRSYAKKSQVQSRNGD